MKLMVVTNHVILSQMRTLMARTEVRFNTYSRRYEMFRQHPVCENPTDRELQMSIAYLYHTSLSILEERQKGLADYFDDVNDILSSFTEITEPQERDELKENLFIECRQEIADLDNELRHIDEGIAMAKRHEAELMAE